ncbi:metal dependent phosphohydrolase [Mycobacteroides abscessus subsp. abscessus]|uniref:HD domain-containing protein n=1 Tax=Mycobacteroides abscessus TaxID=36809 RepID=UPI0009286445|nr:HD domain-containing protein [Mycobacteroides abscessus]SHU64265.1 metal dependent phosphohydrolase [Mycobacteroides abscessus subsp. abscessus]
MVAGGGDIRQRAEDLARRFLAQELPRRWEHTCGVARQVEQLAVDLPEKQKSILIAAAWLHDIGYSTLLVQNEFHPIDGARYAALTKFPAAVVSLIAYHTGAEVEAEERGLSKLLLQIPRPPAGLLEILSCADLCTSPDGKPVDPARRVQEILARYPRSNPVHRAVSRSGPGLIESAHRVQAGLGKSRDVAS